MNEIAVPTPTPVGQGHIQLSSRPGQAPTLQDLVPCAEIIYRAQGDRPKRTKESILASMLFGERFGLSPLEAVGAVHVIDGIPALSAGMIAARIQKSGTYRFRQESLDDNGCTLRWEEKDEQNGTWEVVGKTSFTRQQAEDAGLLTKYGWKAYFQDLCFARALTRGARRFTPSLFQGSIYDPEELQQPEALPQSAAGPTQAAAGPTQAKGASVSLADRVAAAAAATAVDAEFRDTTNDATATANDATATVNDAAATANDATATVNDAAATANDATATVNDAAATANDATATVNDATATVNDATATVNDATATVNDAAATANDARGYADLQAFIRTHKIRGSAAIRVLTEVMNHPIERISEIPEERIGEAIDALDAYLASL